MTRDSTQLIAAVTVVVAILASITVMTEIVTPEGNDTLQGDWYLTELYSLEDGKRVTASPRTHHVTDQSLYRITRGQLHPRIVIEPGIDEFPQTGLLEHGHGQS